MGQNVSGSEIVKAKFHKASLFGACLELVWSWFEPNSITLAGSELAPNRSGAGSELVWS